MKLLKRRHAGCSRIAWMTLASAGLTLAFVGNAFGAPPVPLGDAATFGALSSTAMTNAGGLTVVNGDIGSSTSIAVGVTNGSSGSKYGAGASQLANAQASLLIQRISAESADERMPPEGQPLSAEEVATIGRWIDHGAPEKKPAK